MHIVKGTVRTRTCSFGPVTMSVGHNFGTFDEVQTNPNKAELMKKWLH